MSSMRKIFLLSIFLLSSFTPFLVQADSETLIGVGTDGRFACLLVEETISGAEFNYNLLVRFSSKFAIGYRSVRFDNNLRKLRSNIASTRSKIVTAREEGKSQKIANLKAKRVRLKARLADIKDCRNNRGQYVNGGNGSSGGSSGGGSGGSGGSDGGVEALTACEVATEIDSRSLPLSAALSLRESGEQEVFSRIISGDSCTVGSSAVVKLRIVSTQDDRFLCSGTVIGDRVILTAAHCLEDVSSNNRIERVDVLVGNSTFSTTNFAYHPSFNSPDEANDIGIVVTNTNLPTNHNSIISSSKSLQVGEDLVIAGFGLDENGNNGFLRAGYNTISSFSSKAISLRFADSNGDTNTCSGDSGGPLFIQRDSTWVLAGVTSNGIRANCGAGDVSNFANLLDSSNRSFINSIVPGLLN